MSGFNQSDFILSLVGKKSTELHKILLNTIEEGLSLYKKMYINIDLDKDRDDMDIIRKSIDLYKSTGYMLGIKINSCVDILRIIEENETKRIMYSEIYKDCCFGADTFLSMAETQYKNYISNNLSNMDKYAKLVSYSTDQDLLKKYKKEIETVEMMDKIAIVNHHNHKVSSQLYCLVVIKTTIEKKTNGGSEYL